MRQMTFSDAGFEVHSKQTRRQRFLDEMNAIVPWQKLCRLTQTAFVGRIGYRNSAKGLRRLGALVAGDFQKLGDFIARLPLALEIPAEVVDQAVSDTRAQLKAEAEADRRAKFKPHAIIVTERTIPSSITFCAFTGGGSTEAY